MKTKMHPLNQDPGTTGVTMGDYSVQSSVTVEVDACPFPGLPGAFIDEEGGLWVPAAPVVYAFVAKMEAALALLTAE